MSLAMKRSAEAYKRLSLQEFTQAAEHYESAHPGVYGLCKQDYPVILQELAQEPFDSLLDAGCGPGALLQLIVEKFPNRQYVGIDLCPAMIALAQKKHLASTECIVGDCEHLPFAANRFDVVVCSQSFHHYPNPQNFFTSVHKVLKPGGRFILRDMSLGKWGSRFVNHLELPVLNRLGYGDVKIFHQQEIQQLCEQSGLILERFSYQRWCRLHAVIRKPC